MKNEKYAFRVPEQKRIRLIINTDAKNEADDQYAIVHALLTPQFEIKGIIGAHFGDEKSKTSMLDSYDEIKKIMKFMDIEREDLIFHGAGNRIIEINNLPDSDGSDFIIQEAMRNDSKRLFCIFLGPLTDMAVALLKKPEITGKLTVVWIGGGEWPDGGWEYNLLNDIQAANTVFQSGVSLWQIPRNVYSRIRVSLSELQVKVRPSGKIGKYLFEQMLEVNNLYADNQGWPAGESWSLGDSAAIGVLMDDQEFYYSVEFAPVINEEMKYLHKETKNKIRVYKNIDSRFILEDFYSKLILYNS